METYFHDSSASKSQIFDNISWMIYTIVEIWRAYRSMKKVADLFSITPAKFCASHIYPFFEFTIANCNDHPEDSAEHSIVNGVSFTSMPGEHVALKSEDGYAVDGGINLEAVCTPSGKVSTWVSNGMCKRNEGSRIISS